MDLGSGVFRYEMNPEFYMRRDPCVGEEGQAMCSNYGAVRRPIGGPRGIHYPELMQRSPYFLDEYGPPVFWPETSSLPPLDREMWAGVTTRLPTINQQSVREYPATRYNLYPRNWSIGFTGMDSVGGNLPSKMMWEEVENTRYLATQNPYHYGSYGVPVFH